ncbi:putative bifunctional diguanylate cyclase/phosphodiesterase [Roseobacteraceae bacterium S113]
MLSAHANSEARLDRVLDTLASRAGIASVIGFLIGVCGLVGLYTQSVVTQLQRDHEVFRDAQLRNGYVAMSDVNRLVVAAQTALLNGGMTPEYERAFVNATDILFVRIDNFRMVMERGEFSFGLESIGALEEIITISDDAVNAGFPDLQRLVNQLLQGNENARENLVKFLDTVRRQGDFVLEQQSYAVRKQQIVVLSNLLGLSIIGFVALLFLRREVLGRRAREDAEKRVEFLAFFDPLTELPNRVQFQDRLDVFLSTLDVTTLVYIDLDDFKLINDTYGHAMGDHVLRHVAGILSAHSQVHEGFAARLAGDEFAMAFPGKTENEVGLLCEALMEDVRRPLQANGQTLNVGISLGLAASSQLNEGMDRGVDSLCRVADFALYASKTNGRNQMTAYDQELEDKFLERRAMVEELPRAISNRELEVHLQPKVLLPQGKVYGFEALVRWRRDGRVIPPGEFILIAEESGLVVDIDDFVLQSATQTIAEWNSEQGTEFSVSVNLSTLHLNSREVIERVHDALWQSRLAPELLTLEITESTEIRDWDQAGSVISALSDLGCRIALDDFGTGFSSLAYLRLIQADELKVDKSLVDEIERSQDARLLLASVFEIARNLSLSIVVEGIETLEQSSILAEMGAPYGQGYFFGRPLPALDALAASNPVTAKKQNRR